MKKDLNVNINLPQSELAILRKIANETERQKLINKLYGCIQLPDDFDYKKELEQNIMNKYNS